MTRANSIYSIESASPEQRLAAAVIRQALLDANAGSTKARRWLHDDAMFWLVFITPPTHDLEEIHARLLDRLHPPVDERQRTR